LLDPVVDHVGFDAELCGSLGDAQLAVTAGSGVDVAVLMSGAACTVTAGLLDLGREGVLPVTEISDEGGVQGADVGVPEGPAAVVAAGP
jgi:hypothetical protein